MKLLTDEVNKGETTWSSAMTTSSTVNRRHSQELGDQH